jgi:putative transposase
MTLLRHFDTLGTARFITFSTFRRRPLLLNNDACEALANELIRLRCEKGVRLLGYVFMPDHVHLVVHPPDGLELGRVVGQVKARSARAIGQIPELLGEVIHSRDCESVHVWQLRCYDHNCRSSVETREKIEYCHKNPVTRGLVEKLEKWRWSSYSWYEGIGDAPIEVDSVETL